MRFSRAGTAWEARRDAAVSLLEREDRFALDSARSGNFWLSDTPLSPSRFGGAYNRLCTFARLVDRASGRGSLIFNSHFYTPDQGEWRMRSARLLVREMASRRPFRADGRLRGAPGPDPGVP